MQVTKVRIADDNGLVPAGAYFAKLARNFEQANAVEAARREALDAEDARLEARYRRASATRSNTYRPETHAALM